MSKLQRLGIVSMFLLVSVGCDQATKHIASVSLKDSASRSFLGDTFRLTYAENIGAFLSLGGNLPDAARFWILTVMVGAILLSILVFALVSGKLNRVEVSGYAMIVGGGLSNWVDRLTNSGRVVDFMNLGLGPVRTGIFNVADLAIVFGVAVLLIAGAKKKQPLEQPPQALT